MFFFNFLLIVGKTVIHNLNRLVVRAVFILFRNACLKNDIHCVHRIECENMSVPLRLFLNHVFISNTIIIVDINVYLFLDTPPPNFLEQLRTNFYSLCDKVIVWIKNHAYLIDYSKQMEFLKMCLVWISTCSFFLM